MDTGFSVAQSHILLHKTSEAVDWADSTKPYSTGRKVPFDYTIHDQLRPMS